MDTVPDPVIQVQQDFCYQAKFSSSQITCVTLDRIIFPVIIIIIIIVISNLQCAGYKIKIRTSGHYNCQFDKIVH